MENSEKTALRLPVYIEKRVSGENKQQAMLRANYTEAKSRTPSLLEATKTYQRAVQSIINGTSNLIRDGVESFDVSEITKLPVKERVFVLKQLAEIHKILTPTIKVKEEELKDGTIKRTKWQSVGD